MDPKSIVEALAMADQEIDQLEERLVGLRLFCHLAHRLRTSWRSVDDPGKRGGYAFFVRDYECSGEGTYRRVERCVPFHARELVDNLAAAEAGVESRDLMPRIVPVPLGELSEAAWSKCCWCGERKYIVGSYFQSFDSPDGDVWSLRLYWLCPTCREARKFAGQEEGGRFLGSLKPAGE